MPLTCCSCPPFSKGLETYRDELESCICRDCKREESVKIGCCSDCSTCYNNADSCYRLAAFVDYLSFNCHIVSLDSFN